MPGFGIVGVIAQLATVQDPQLNAVLSFNYLGVLSTLVVATAAEQSSLRRHLDSVRLEKPPMLCLQHVTAYK